VFFSFMLDVFHHEKDEERAAVKYRKETALSWFIFLLEECWRREQEAVDS
jgi:hypothetical protein